MLIAEVHQELVEGVAAGGGGKGRLLPVGRSRVVEEVAGVQFAWGGRLGRGLREGGRVATLLRASWSAWKGESRGI